MSDNWQLKAILSAVDKMSPVLKSITATAKTTRKYVGDVGSSAVNLAGKIGMPLGLITGALAGFSVVGLKQTVGNFAALGDEVHKSAQRIGVSVDEYQRIKYVAGQSGVSAEELGSSMGRLNKNIAEVATGKGQDLAALFHKANISMRGANGQLRSATELLPELAALFARNGNAAVQARMGNAVFGKSWQALAPLLQGGKEGIDELNARYKMLGISVEENGIIAGEKFGDQMDDMNQVMRSYGNTITSKLLPVLAPMLEGMIKWAVANKDLITTKITKFIEDIAISLGKVNWTDVIDGIGSFISGIKDFIEFVGGAKNALIGLVIVMNAQAIIATALLLKSFIRLGIGMGTLALNALAPIAPLQTLTTGLVGAEAKAAMMVNTMGKLGAAMGIVGAAYAGYQFGSWLNDSVINPAIQKISGDDSQSLGGLVYDAFNSPTANSSTTSLVSSRQVKASGQIEVSFKDMPPGARVEQTKAGGDVPVNTNVGYRSYATGMAM